MASMETLAPIERLTPLVREETGKVRADTLADAAGESLFGSIFRSAIDNVRTTDAAKTNAQYLLATGQLDNPAVLGIYSTKAELASSLLIQLRNKALDAYSELTRISL